MPERLEADHRHLIQIGQQPPFDLEPAAAPWRGPQSGRYRVNGRNAQAARQGLAFRGLRGDFFEAAIGRYSVDQQWPRKLDSDLLHQTRSSKTALADMISAAALPASVSRVFRTWAVSAARPGGGAPSG